MNNNNKYQEDYTFIYNGSVLHDNLFNEGHLDTKWANEFAEIYFALKHPNGCYAEEKEEFMYGWEEFFYHMFN